MVTPEGDYSFSGLRELCGQLEDYGNYLQELAENRNILNVPAADKELLCAMGGKSKENRANEAVNLMWLEETREMAIDALCRVASSIGDSSNQFLNGLGYIEQSLVPDLDRTTDGCVAELTNMERVAGMKSIESVSMPMRRLYGGANRRSRRVSITEMYPNESNGQSAKNFVPKTMRDLDLIGHCYILSEDVDNSSKSGSHSYLKGGSSSANRGSPSVRPKPSNVSVRVSTNFGSNASSFGINSSGTSRGSIATSGLWSIDTRRQSGVVAASSSSLSAPSFQKASPHSSSSSLEKSDSQSASSLNVHTTSTKVLRNASSVAVPPPNKKVPAPPPPPPPASNAPAAPPPPPASNAPPVPAPPPLPPPAGAAPALAPQKNPKNPALSRLETIDFTRPVSLSHNESEQSADLIVISEDEYDGRGDLKKMRMTAEYLDENQGVWFAEGSEVLIISADEVWAECYNQDGEVGVVPMNHLENIGEPVTAF